MMRTLPSSTSFKPHRERAPADVDLAGHDRGQGRGRRAGRDRLGLDAEIVHERHHDIVGARAAGRIRDGVLVGRVGHGLERGIGLDVPVEIAGAGEGRQQDAHRRALGEHPHDARDPDPDADIGAAGDDRLHGLAGTRGAEIVEGQPVFLEDAGVLAERRHLVFPIVDLPDRDLELVVRPGRREARKSNPMSAIAPAILLAPIRCMTVLPVRQGIVGWVELLRNPSTIAETGFRASRNAACWVTRGSTARSYSICRGRANPTYGLRRDRVPCAGPDAIWPCAPRRAAAAGRPRRAAATSIPRSAPPRWAAR